MPSSTDGLLCQATSYTCSEDIRSGFSERDLHPLLVRFVNDRFDGYAKTIFHEKSDKSRHPDLVSGHFLLMTINKQRLICLVLCKQVDV